MVDVRILSDKELIKIIEQQSDWQFKVIAKARVEFSQRTIDPVISKEIARDFYISRCNLLLDRSGFDPKEMTLPTSELLSNDECLTIFKSAFQSYMNKRDMHYGGLEDYTPF